MDHHGKEMIGLNEKEMSTFSNGWSMVTERSRKSYNKIREISQANIELSESVTSGF